MPKAIDSLLAGLGLAGSFALMGALEPKLGVKLVVPPMMASGIIFFSASMPPSPKGFLSGTIGCATVSAMVYEFLKGRMSLSAAQGAAAGCLLVWYKATSCIFPPNAVLCTLMAGGGPGAAAPVDFVLKTWVAGHACMYASAYALSYLRQATRVAISKRRLSALASLDDAALKEIFTKFDTSKDGSLDPSELKLAMRVALGSDISIDDCKRIVSESDKKCVTPKSSNPQLHFCLDCDCACANHTDSVDSAWIVVTAWLTFANLRLFASQRARDMSPPEQRHCGASVAPRRAPNGSLCERAVCGVIRMVSSSTMTELTNEYLEHWQL